jgi:hypothetical protein
MSQFESITVPSWFGPIRIIDDVEFWQYRPTRKVRGRRGYYRRLHRVATAFSVTPSGFYDYMHWHVDWPGLGNVRWKERREHLSALFTTFRNLLADTTEWSTPHQAWLQINAGDSSQDAVYLHTGNSNTDSFPNRFADVEWDGEIPERLKPFVTDASWQFGRLDGFQTHFIVRPRPAA